jgi:hypothetical protein
MKVMVYQTAWHHIPEDSNLQAKTINIPWELQGLFPEGKICSQICPRIFLWAIFLTFVGLYRMEK